MRVCGMIVALLGKAMFIAAGVYLIKSGFFGTGLFMLIVSAITTVNYYKPKKATKAINKLSDVIAVKCVNKESKKNEENSDSVSA